MDELLFLAHRIPYPPNKGDKIRSWNFLRHLAQQYRVYLGCFIDDGDDWRHTESLRRLCQDCFFAPLAPRRARLRSLRGLFNRQPLTLPYFYDATLDRWVTEVLARPGLTRVLAYCSAMAQYIPLDVRRSRRCIADVVDVDSEKWFDYADRMPKVTAWILKREGTRLRRFEQEIAGTFYRTLVATQAEQVLYRSFAAESAQQIVCVRNGVDIDYFNPDRRYDRPAQMSGTPLVFTGAMDYWPNVDGATHFVRSILPLIRSRIPDARVFIIGANPTRQVKSLHNGESVVVTGRVPDVRPFVAHAKAIIVPLRIARGVQNKILEGMAMAKPVIASAEAIAGVNGVAGLDFMVAASADEFADAVFKVTKSEIGATMGQNARKRIVTDYQWPERVREVEAMFRA